MYPLKVSLDFDFVYLLFYLLMHVKTCASEEEPVKAVARDLWGILGYSGRIAALKRAFVSSR